MLQGRIELVNVGMDDVICSGSEADVLDCPHITTHNCGASEGAGVRCNTLNLLSSGEAEGNVIINGRPVCDQGWDDRDAGVVCRMLGWESGVAVAGSEYGEVTTAFLMTEVSCEGTEDNLLSCPHSLLVDCEPGQAAGVLCRDREVMAQVSLLLGYSQSVLCFSGPATENRSSQEEVLLVSHGGNVDIIRFNQ